MRLKNTPFLPIFYRNSLICCDRLPKPHRDHIQSIYNAHLLHSSTVDPFKLALYKLMGRLDPSRRSVPLVTATTEDWLWFQLAMLDEEEEGAGLNALGEVLMGYGERYFEGGPAGSASTSVGVGQGVEGQVQAKGRTGLWASVLLMVGQFERVCFFRLRLFALTMTEGFFSLRSIVGCCCALG